MKVRIKGDISGSRDGRPWPKRGETMELPDDEGAQLCASGLAVPAANTGADIETAVPDDADAETRTNGLTKDTAGAVTSDGSGDQEQADSSDGDQAAAGSKDQTPAPAKKAAAPAKKTAAKRAPAKPAEGK